MFITKSALFQAKVSSTLEPILQTTQRSSTTTLLTVLKGSVVVLVLVEAPVVVLAVAAEMAAIPPHLRIRCLPLIWRKYKEQFGKAWWPPKSFLVCPRDRYASRGWGGRGGQLGLNHLLAVVHIQTANAFSSYLWGQGPPTVLELIAADLWFVPHCDTQHGGPNPLQDEAIITAHVLGPAFHTAGPWEHAKRNQLAPGECTWQVHGKYKKPEMCCQVVERLGARATTSHFFDGLADLTTFVKDCPYLGPSVPVVPTVLADICPLMLLLMGMPGVAVMMIVMTGRTAVWR